MTAGWEGPALVGDRLVVVAPHPDDEVLATGGLMAWTAARGGEVLVVAVTDGEASHARSLAVTPAALRERRAAERGEALVRLGVAATVVRLGIPDQACGAERASLVAALERHLRPGDVIVGPSGGDRHPDHVAVASAVREVAGAVVEQWWEAPTWAHVHGTAAAASSTFVLDEAAWRAKQHAMAAYASQLVALGPDRHDGPVVRPDELAAMMRRREDFARVTTAWPTDPDGRSPRAAGVPAAAAASRSTGTAGR